MLSENQKTRAIAALRAFLDAPSSNGGETPLQRSRTRDAERRRLIAEELGPLLADYLAARLPLAEFKSRVDGINKRNELWGFRGLTGQMFFNMVTNAASDLAECDAEIRAVITAPENDIVARSRINTFAAYVRRIGQEVIDNGGSGRQKPRVGSVPYFASYFWQLQAPQAWPVYYPSGVEKMQAFDLWQATGDPAADYVSFKEVQQELVGLFSERSGQTFDFYGVGHVFWFLRNESGSAVQTALPIAGNADDGGSRADERTPFVISDSYVPPIVSVLPRLAVNDHGLELAALQQATSTSRLFEKHINAALTILGFETKLLGQGSGREPDGIAIDDDDSYVVIWDAKVRANGYAIGTDDRAIREYISEKSRELRRRRTYRNIYYCIVSSRFVGDFEETIRNIRMETDVSEVCLVEAGALVAMVDARLRAPLQFSLGPDGLQRLFADGGIVTSELVREME